MSNGNCNFGLGNTGVDCPTILGVAVKYLLWPMTDKTGAPNKLDLSAVHDQASWDALINNEDPTKRIYPTTGKLVNVDDVRADSLFQTLNNGTNIFLQQGARTVIAFHTGVGPTYLKQLQPNSGVIFGILPVDKAGNIHGNQNVEAGFLYPMKVDNETWDCGLVKPNDAGAQMIRLKFEIDSTENDADIGLMTLAEAGADARKFEGLKDVLYKVPAQVGSATEITVDWVFKYGTAKTKQPLAGLLAAEILFDNLTAPSVDNVVSNAAESPDGTYVLTIVAQTAADDLRFKIIKGGFDDSVIQATPVIAV